MQESAVRYLYQGGGLCTGLLTAADHDGVAGDEGGIVAGQESDDGCKLGRLADTLHGQGIDLLLQNLGGLGFQHIRVDHAGHDGVDGDVLAGGLQRQRTGEAVDGGFGSAVVGLAHVPKEETEEMLTILP